MISLWRSFKALSSRWPIIWYCEADVIMNQRPFVSVWAVGWRARNAGSLSLRWLRRSLRYSRMFSPQSLKSCAASGWSPSIGMVVCLEIWE